MKRVKTIILMISVCALALCMAGLTACGPEPEPEPDPETPVITVTLDKQTESVVEGETFSLTATVKNSTDNPTFKSSNTSVATVSGSGKSATVTGVAAGSATITASVGDKSAACTVTVTAKPVIEDELSLDKDFIVMEDGGDAFKTATLTADHPSGEGTLSFASSDEEVVTVTLAGNVATLTAHKTGSATVTATAGEKSVSCQVDVATYGLDYQLLELELEDESTMTALRVLDSDKNLTGDIRIPAQYWSDEEEGYFPVVEVAENGFKGNGDITSVYLGDELLTVGANAFKECEGLTSVTTGAKLDSVGASAFNSCSALTYFNWSETCVTSIIGAGAFGWTGLTEMVIPETATGFNWGMFQCAEKLESVKIYAPITQIYDSTFLKCDSLKEIWLPATLTTVSGGAFGGYAGFPDDGPGSKGSFTINFAGTQEQWDAVTIADSNNSAIIKSKNSNLTVNYGVEY